MPAQFWTSLLNSPAATGDGTALASSTSLTAISPSSSTSPDFVLPANWLYSGQVLRVSAAGRFSTTGTPTLLLGAYFGGVGGVALATTGAVTTASGAANLTWTFRADIVVRSIGTSGTAMATGYAAGLASATNIVQIPASAAAVATIDTTAAKALVLGAQWGTSSASNTVTCHSWLIEALN